MKTLWKILLVIFIIIMIFFFPEILAFVGDWMASAGFLASSATIAGWIAAGIPWYVGAAVGLGLAYLVDPAATEEIIAKVADIASGVGGAVIGGVLGAIASSPLGMVAIGLGIWWLFFSGRDDKKKPSDQLEHEESGRWAPESYGGGRDDAQLA